ncbi:MAG: hypothetical protein HC873_17395 [Leptolyngbyaceae cyanobacterium SL_1_1]|nr:hypothetical protein [Leptolyngbyaceae cyanobacterium RM1_1_2]NJO11120.1 hypothetical protein [Leptolyngbyaceae cyanobacterium SL_1_1]
MKKLLSQCSVLLLLAAGAAAGWPLEASAEELPSQYQTCRSRLVQPSAAQPAGAEGTGTTPPRLAIERDCVTRVRRFRIGTELCGLNEYRQPTLGEFRQFETHRGSRITRSQPELVRCL